MAEPRPNRLGTISLIVAAIGFCLVNAVPWPLIGTLWIFPGFSLRQLIAAFFDASLVGALADWFAVSALFRHPLGLKLPHTNVIARNKDAVAEAVPRFLTGFVSGDAIQRELAGLDFAGLLARALQAGPQRDSIHDFVRQRLAQTTLATDTRVELGNLVQSVLALVRREVDLPGAGATLATWAREGQFTARVIAGLALLIRTEMDRNHQTLVDFLTQKIKKSAGWQGLFIGAGTTEKILSTIKSELEGIQGNPRHEIRLFLFAALDSWIKRLRSDAAERERFQSLVGDAIGNAEFSAQCTVFVLNLLERMGADLNRPDSRFVGTLEQLENWLVERIGHDEVFRAAFNRNLVALLSDLVVKSRLVETMSDYLATQMKRTDTTRFVRQVEGAVWNDLQYIRVNGAVVGGLAGLVLAVLTALLGR